MHGNMIQWSQINRRSVYGTVVILFPILFQNLVINIQLSKGDGIYETPYSDIDQSITIESYYIGGTAPSSFTQIGYVHAFYIGY